MIIIHQILGRFNDRVVLLRRLLTYAVCIFASFLSWLQINQINTAALFQSYWQKLLKPTHTYSVLLTTLQCPPPSPHTYTLCWFICSSCVAFRPFHVFNLFIIFPQCSFIFRCWTTLLPVYLSIAIISQMLPEPPLSLSRGNRGLTLRVDNQICKTRFNTDKERDLFEFAKTFYPSSNMFLQLQKLKLESHRRLTPSRCCVPYCTTDHVLNIKSYKIES